MSWDESLLLLSVPHTQRSGRCSGAQPNTTPFPGVAQGPALTGPTPGTGSAPSSPAWTKDNVHFHLFFH